jgi:hypothetical protein
MESIIPHNSKPQLFVLVESANSATKVDRVCKTLPMYVPLIIRSFDMLGAVVSSMLQDALETGAHCGR